MREIKFRAFCKKDNLMYYDIQKGIDFDDGSHYSFNDFLEKQSDDYHKWEIMQFTGLCDKNGKEIYESDIVEVEPVGWKEWKEKKEMDSGKKYKEVVKYFLDSFGKEMRCSPFHHSHSRVEVIGNIYEDKKCQKS